ncbi:hypothetical protein QLS91_17005 [Flavobacterium sp. LB2P84]|uniref:hypothetical protein n=1 Tax=Flavobacterium yafengii TaxID=3041253 RepID=UPI0024A82763|nr:hypothetical protein [Flavobacterium yafengii]MDI6034778.1 hypothetical protein [Flavobacterium yafengii]
MEIISYIIVVSILINILVQLGLILRYYYPLIIQYFQNKKITWNSNYDRIIAASFLAFFCLSIYLGRILLTSSNELYLAISYITILFFLTISIYLIHRMGFAERAKNSLISPKKPTIKNFNHLLNNSQLSYLYNELRKYSVIDEKIEKSNFYSDFLSKPMQINLTAFDLYYFHKLVQNNLNLNQRIPLNKFSDSFLTDDNIPYKYSSVKNGKDKERNSDNAKNLNTIFMSFPK